MKSILIAFLLFSSCSLKAQTDSAAALKCDSAVFYQTEITPCFPGGIKFWSRYLDQNLDYPGEARENGIHGSVVVQFVVNKEGQTHDEKVLSGPPELQKEAIRLIKKVTWVPGIQCGKKVNAWKTVSIEFSL